MRKFFTLIAVAAMAITASAQGTYLVAFGVAGQENQGYTIGGTTDSNREVTLEDGTKLPALSFNNNWGTGNENYIKLTTDGGFKTGDVVSLSGVIDNSDESKRGACIVFTLDGDKQTKLYTTDDFVNLKLAPTSTLPVYTHTLTEDAEILYLGRNGNTRTQMTMISVVRNGGDTPAPAEGETFTVTGAGSGIFGKAFDSMVVPFEFDATTMEGTFKDFLGGTTTIKLKWEITNPNKNPQETGAMYDSAPVSGLGEIQTIAGYYKMCSINDFTGNVIFKQEGVNFAKLDNILVGVDFASQIEVVTIESKRYYEVNIMLGGDYSTWDADKSDWTASGTNYFKLTINVPLSSGPTDAIDAVAADVDEDAPVEYYNIQGMRVANPAPGQLVIRRQGNKVSKVIFR